MEKNIEKLKKDYLEFLKDTKKIEEINGYIEAETSKIKKSFSKEKLELLSLEDYCIGNSNNENLSYLLERGTQELGSIRGGNSSKFGVYYSKNKKEYVYTNKFDDENDAIEKIKKFLLEIYNANKLSDIKNNELSPMFRYKFFYIYHSDKIIPIYSENYLAIIFNNLGFSFDSYTEAQVKLLEIFGSIKNKDKTTLNFMYFLNTYFNISRILDSLPEKHIISKEKIYNILISLSVSNFLIFSGPSGVGKSSIIKDLSNIISGSNSFHKLAVKSNFSDESSILGYWNPLLSKYEGTETLKFLIKSYKNSEIMYFLLLDEMNLSKVENYFSTFLSEIDKLKQSEESKITLFETQITTKKQYENIKYFLDVYFELDYIDFIEFGDTKEDFENYFDSLVFDENGNIEHEDIRNIKLYLPLSKNLKIIGTINEDETTQVLSNKVLDRSQFIHFEVLDLFENRDSFKIDEDLLNRDFYSLLEKSEELNYLLKNGDKLFGKAKFDYFKELFNKLNKEIQKININESIAYRALEEILNYIKNYIGDKKIDFEKALDNQISQKVLTKLKAFSLVNKDHKEAFKNIGELVKDYEKSIKAYNHLKSNSNLDD